MAFVTVIVKRMRANTPGRWAPDLWYYGVNEDGPKKRITDGPIFVANGGFDMHITESRPKPDDTAMAMRHLYGMGIISKNNARRIVDFGGGS